jgi:hypothetical protein
MAEANPAKHSGGGIVGHPLRVKSLGNPQRSVTEVLH